MRCSPRPPSCIQPSMSFGQSTAIIAGRNFSRPPYAPIVAGGRHPDGSRSGAGPLMRSLLRHFTAVSVQRLNPDQVAVVVRVPDSCRLGGSIDDSSPVIGERLGHLIGGPMVGLGIVAKHLAAVQHAGPHFAVLVR